MQPFICHSLLQICALARKEKGGEENGSPSQPRIQHSHSRTRQGRHQVTTRTQHSLERVSDVRALPHPAEASAHSPESITPSRKSAHLQGRRREERAPSPRHRNTHPPLPLPLPHTTIQWKRQEHNNTHPQGSAMSASCRTRQTRAHAALHPSLPLSDLRVGKKKRRGVERRKSPCHSNIQPTLKLPHTTK